MENPVSVATPESKRQSRLTLLFPVLLLLISVAYIAQIASPLRLINDGIDYLSQASSALDGHGFVLRDGTQSMRPPGYPALVYVLGKLGIANSWTIVALNCFLLAIGSYASYFALRRSLELSDNSTKLICLLSLLSFLMVRNVTYPLSDISFFGASAACLLVLLKTETQPGTRRLQLLLLLAPLLFFCIKLRTIGVVLVPAFVWAALGGIVGAKHIYPVLRRYSVAVLCALMLIAIFVGKAFLDSRYMHFNAPIFQRQGVVQSVISDLKYQTSEWGEMAVNAPASKLPRTVLTPMRIVGAISIGVFVLGIWARRSQPDSLLIYVIGFACIVFPYPWFDTRLWLPILPFVLGYVLLGLKRLLSTRVLHIFLPTYCCVYCVLGVAAFIYSTRLTYSGPRFPDLFGDGKLRGTYKVAFQGEKRSDVDADALYLLRRYDKRARQSNRQ